MYTDDRITTSGTEGAWGQEPAAPLAGLAVSEPRTHAPAEGERRLLAALLEDGIRCYQKYAFSGTRRGRRLFAEAKAWFTDPHVEAGFSFDYVCDVLGIDPDYLRHSLERWRAEQFTGGRISAAACRPYNRAAGPSQALWPQLAAVAGLHHRRSTVTRRHDGFVREE
jgi:hypothetical protein